MDKTVGSSQSARGLFSFVIEALQLALLLEVAVLFSLEENLGFPRLAPYLFGSVVIHWLLPLRLRLPFFVVASVGALFITPGYPVAPWILGIGAFLLALCHLPIRFGIRLFLIILAVVGLATLRSGLVSSGLPGGVLTLVGSIFMFRLVIYLYELPHESAPVSIWARLGYFFCLPNACFPLFPIIDYKTYLKTYYNDDAHRIYQTGLRWIFRGIIQLLLYRVIYYHFTPATAEVQNFSMLIQFILSSYLLLLRVTGLFHLIAGILHLFGFNLPVTNNRIFLANGFSDLWRRVNIYWKDFMTKLFFYPAYMKLRSKGAERGLLLATAWAFLVTWLLHSYQTFWLQGNFPLTWVDVAFWSILGIGVAHNSLTESRVSRKSSLKTPTFSVRSAARESVNVVSMFVFMCLLFSLWSCSTLGEWWSVISVARTATIIDIFLVILSLISAIGLGTFAQYISGEGIYSRISTPVTKRVPLSGAIIIVCTVLCIFGLPHVYRQLHPVLAAELMTMTECRLNSRDEDMLVRGYYDNLLNEQRFSNQLWELQAEKPMDWDALGGSNAAVMTDDLYQIKFKPSTSATIRGKILTTNSMAFRDKEYAKTRDNRTYRMAVQGASPVMGAGVSDGEVFEALLEDKLNQAQVSPSYDTYELLNFGIAGSSLLQHVAQLEDQILPLSPQVLLVITFGSQSLPFMKNVEKVASYATARYPDLAQLFHSADVDLENQRNSRRQFNALGDEMASWCFEHLASLSRKNGIVPVFVYWPHVNSRAYIGEEERWRGLAEKAGMLAVSLDGVNDGYDKRLLVLARWDKHPSALSHQLVAERLFHLLLELGDKIHLDVKPGVYEQVESSATLR